MIANVPLCREHFRLVLRADAFPPSRPGQFVQIACEERSAVHVEECEIPWQPGQLPEPVDPAWLDRQAVLRRPFSLAGRRDIDGTVELDIIHRVVGVGTAWLEHLQPGDRVSILGPLGNGFTLPEPAKVSLLVGGGVGIPPMIYLAEKLVGTRAVAFAGAVTRDLLALSITTDALPAGPESVDPLYNIAEFSRRGIPTVISTDDGSFGYRGFVTQALQQYIDRYFTRAMDQLEIFVCGPEAMMRRVADIALERGIPCQVAVERAMACGMGTCQSCCIKIKKPDPAAPPLAGQPWAYRLACTDGPVFTAAELIW